jgi:23S rRNA pseudouridine955/2504/2580 synthase
LHADDRRADRRGLLVDPDEQAQRLDNYLARKLPEFPKSYIFKIIRSGEIRVNGARSSPDYRLGAGDVLRLPPKAEHALAGTLGPSEGVSSAALRAQSSALVQGQASDLAKRLPILYEDEAILVIDKPFGLAVHGGSGVNLGVIETLRVARPEQKFLELAHRLDRETSGVLVVAKKRLALVQLQEQFRARLTRKTYQALVFGKVPKRDKTIRLALSRDAETTSGDRRVRIDPQGQEAVSVVKGLSHALFCGSDVLSRVSVVIETGRTHQIRVHLASSHFPIIGDPKYGDFNRNRELAQAGYKRMYLHAWQLGFRHPITAATMLVEAPLPRDFLFLAPLQVVPSSGMHVK